MGKNRKNKKKKSDADKQSSASESFQGGSSPRRKRRANSVRSRSERSSHGSECMSSTSEANVPVSHHQAAGPSGAKAAKQNNTPAANAAKVKLPPLVVKNVPLKKLVSSFASMGIEAEYKLTGFGIKVMLRTKAEFDLVSKFLKDSKAEFFTHDIPGEKPFKVVIRGLPSYDVTTIEAEIKDRYKLAPTAVYRMTRRNENVKKYPDCLFLVHFKKGTVTLNALQAIRSLFSIIIRWEPYRGGHRDVTQCQRCLSFGHGTRNCNIKPRCSKCAQDHPTSNCPVEETVAFKCANCGGTHQGSDRQCPKREEFKLIRKQASTNNQPGRKKETARALPAYTDANFPALQPRRGVPNLPPLPLNNQQARRSAQHPPTAAAAQPNQAADETDDGSPLSDEELVFLVTEVLIIKRTCRTRAEQLRAVTSIISRHGV